MPAPFSDPWRVDLFDELDSTSSEAMRRAADSDSGPVWIRTIRQTAGRGRMRRPWLDAPGNLFATALFPWPGARGELPLLSFAAALGLHDACLKAGAKPSAVQIKWPNDLVCGPAKLAGILLESGSGPSGVWVAAGFGVNIATAPALADRETSCLRAVPGVGDVDAEKVLRDLDAAFRGWIVTLLAGGFPPLREAWLARSATLGRRVRVSETGEEGVGHELDTDGGLVLLRADGTRSVVRAGEIVMQVQAEGDSRHASGD